MSNSIVVGIDVAKDKVNVCILPENERFAVTVDEYPALVERLISLAPTLVVMEATGGYERRLQLLLAKVELPIAVVNPRPVRDYAKGLGFLAKTDDIDAFVIARYAQDVRPQPDQHVSEKSLELKELLSRRRQLVSLRSGELARKQQTASKKVIRTIDAVLKPLNKQIAEIDKELDKHIKELPEWRDKDEILRSVPGIGQQTSKTLMVELPELGSISRLKVAALAGVAPMNHDSGKFRGTRHIRGGRIAVRNALYMACVTAIRRNPVIKSLYDRLRKAGKKYKVAMTACMRKLLIIVNAMVKKKNKFTAKTV